MRAEYIDHMGTDLTVVNSARVSFDKESEWDEVDQVAIDDYDDVVTVYTLSEKDQRLIKYLATHGHWTPFSHVAITMRETIPIFVARQRFKHMVGFTYNEVSRRYVDDPPEFYFPDKWRKKAENKKQGSSEDEFIDIVLFGQEAISISEEYKECIKHCEDTYNLMVKSGVAPEQARMILPQSMYTSYYVTGSLAAWSRAYNLRSKTDAQLEIRELSKQWDDVISSISGLEHSWKALKHDL